MKKKEYLVLMRRSEAESKHHKNQDPTAPGLSAECVQGELKSDVHIWIFGFGSDGRYNEIITLAEERSVEVFS